MVRFQLNIHSIFLFLIEHVAFSYQPIPRALFVGQSGQSKSANGQLGIHSDKSSSEESLDKIGTCDNSINVELSGLSRKAEQDLAQYKPALTQWSWLNSNKAYVIQLAILIYMTLKSVTLYLMFDSSNHKAAASQEFSEIYFPRPHGMSRQPKLYDKVAIFMNLAHCLLFYRSLKHLRTNDELISDKKLIQLSHQRLCIYQLDMAYWKMLNVGTWTEYRCLIKAGLLHFRERLTRGMAHCSAHRRLTLTKNKLDLSHNDHTSNRKLLFRWNVVDFDECFKAHGLRLVELGQESGDAMAACRWLEPSGDSLPGSWHYTKPVHRMDLEDLAIMTLTLLFYSCIFVASFMYIGWLILKLEIDMVERAYGHLNLSFLNRAQYLIKPPHIFRLIELILVQMGELYMYVEAIFVFWVAATLKSRIWKLTSLLERDNEEMKGLDSMINRGGGFENHNSHIRAQSALVLNQNQDQDREKDRGVTRESSRLKLLDQIRLTVRLAQLVHLEFNNLNSRFSDFLNIFIISATIQMALYLSITLNAEVHPEEHTILLLVAIVSGLPMLMILLTISLIEKGFSNIRAELNKLVVNKSHLLDISLIYRITKTGGQLNNYKDRTVLILGHYPVTFATLGSVLGIIATVVLYQTRD